MNILVAGVGNVLRSDDGFGCAVAHHLIDLGVPEGVRVMEIGIGGIHLVQALFDTTDALVIVDAVDHGRPPGTVMVIEPTVVDVGAMTLTERHDQLGDMHYATPERAMMLARGLGVLPAVRWLVGCQPVDAQSVGQELSHVVRRAVPLAAVEVRRLVTEAGVAWS